VGGRGWCLGLLLRGSALQQPPSPSFLGRSLPATSCSGQCWSDRLENGKISRNSSPAKRVPAPWDARASEGMSLSNQQGDMSWGSGFGHAPWGLCNRHTKVNITKTRHGMVGDTGSSWCSRCLDCVGNNRWYFCGCQISASVVPSWCMGSLSVTT
jgi:hypothetical protein